MSIPFIINLPIELSVYIQNFFEIADLINFKVTSSKSLKIAYDRGIILWQELDINEYIMHKIKEETNFEEDFFGLELYESLGTYGPGYITDDQILKRTFRIHSDVLTKFAVNSDRTSNQCLQYLMRFNNISTINLSYSNDITTECLTSFVNKFNNTLKSIKLFKLSNVVFEDHIIDNCLLLEELEIKEGMKLSQTSFISILKKHGRRLKKISIFYSTLGMSNYLLLSIVHFCPNLQFFYGSRRSFDSRLQNHDLSAEDLNQTYIKEPMIHAGLILERATDLTQSLFDSLKNDLILRGIEKFYIDDVASELIGFDQNFNI